MSDLQYWANVFQIVGGVGVVLAVVALVISWIQLRKTEKATRGQMLLAVDQALAPYDDIRKKARNENWDAPPNKDKAREDERHRIKQYMGVWERVEHLLADGNIEPATVVQLYGDRVKYLMRNPVIREYLIDKPDDWDTFVAFASRIGEVKSDDEIRGWVREVKSGAGRA
jgi:hypothetical protein